MVLEFKILDKINERKLDLDVLKSDLSLTDKEIKQIKKYNFSPSFEKLLRITNYFEFSDKDKDEIMAEYKDKQCSRSNKFTKVNFFNLLSIISSIFLLVLILTIYNLNKVDTYRRYLTDIWTIFFLVSALLFLCISLFSIAYVFSALVFYGKALIIDRIKYIVSLILMVLSFAILLSALLLLSSNFVEIILYLSRRYFLD